MGPRGSALICGYTDYHGQLEACLAGLKNKEVRMLIVLLSFVFSQLMLCLVTQ